MSDRLSLIAGSGALVPEVIEAAQRRGMTVQVLSLVPRRLPRGVLGARLIATDIASGIEAIRTFGATRIAMAGGVMLADGAREAVLGQAGEFGNTRGDTGMSALASYLEDETGAQLIGAHELAPELLAPAGLIAGPQPEEALSAAGRSALVRARQAGRLDLGQGLVVAGARPIASEDIAGTDALLRRVAGFRRWGLAGDGRAPLVLAKAMKPDQPRTIDMPAIGPTTVARAKAAGIALIAVEAGGTLLIERGKLAKAAERAGLPVVGLTIDD